ncbi:MAG: type VI secretion system baseplate subunit TssG [Minicystis sp.]
MSAHGWGKSPSVKRWLLDEGYQFDFFQAVALLELHKQEQLYAKALEAEARRRRTLPTGGYAAAAQQGTTRPADTELPWADEDEIELEEADDEAHAEQNEAAAIASRLEASIARHFTSVGEGSEPAKEAVRFSSLIHLAFPATDIATIKDRKGEHDPYEMKVNFMGLSGALGPLPTPFADLVFQRSVQKDFGLRDFLDIFNHRLVSIFYRIRKRHRFGMGVRSPEQDNVARYLYALIGIGNPRLHGRLALPDRSLLAHVGLFAKEHRTMAGLEAILRHHFGVPIRGIALVGRFYPIDPANQTAIGSKGKNRRLGDTAFLGGRVWDQESGFDIRIGPVPLAAFLRFLPGGDALPRLCELTRFYVGETFSFGIQLVLEASEVPQAQLLPGKATHERAEGVRLGYTSWLGAIRGGPAPPEIRLGGAALTAALDHGKRTQRAKRAG